MSTWKAFRETLARGLDAQGKRQDKLIPPWLDAVDVIGSTIATVASVGFLVVSVVGASRRYRARHPTK